MTTPSQTLATCAAREQRVAEHFNTVDEYMRQVLARYRADMALAEKRLAQPIRYREGDES